MAEGGTCHEPDSGDRERGPRPAAEGYPAAAVFAGEEAFGDHGEHGNGGDDDGGLGSADPHDAVVLKVEIGGDARQPRSGEIGKVARIEAFLRGGEFLHDPEERDRQGEAGGAEAHGRQHRHRDLDGNERKAPEDDRKDDRSEGAAALVHQGIVSGAAALRKMERN